MTRASATVPSWKEPSARHNLSPPSQGGERSRGARRGCPTKTGGNAQSDAKPTFHRPSLALPSSTSRLTSREFRRGVRTPPIPAERTVRSMPGPMQGRIQGPATTSPGGVALCRCRPMPGRAAPRRCRSPRPGTSGPRTGTLVPASPEKRDQPLLPLIVPNHRASPDPTDSENDQTEHDGQDPESPSRSVRWDLGQ